MNFRSLFELVLDFLRGVFDGFGDFLRAVGYLFASFLRAGFYSVERLFRRALNRITCLPHSSTEFFPNFLGVLVDFFAGGLRCRADFLGADTH